MKIREFLKDVRSGLLEETNTRELFRRMRIAEQVNDDAPKNIGLLMFSENADNWFHGAWIKVVQFAGGTAICTKTYWKGRRSSEDVRCVNGIRFNNRRRSQSYQAAFPTVFPTVSHRTSRDAPSS